MQIVDMTTPIISREKRILYFRLILRGCHSESLVVMTRNVEPLWKFLLHYQLSSVLYIFP